MLDKKKLNINIDKNKFKTKLEKIAGEDEILKLPKIASSVESTRNHERCMSFDEINKENGGQTILTSPLMTPRNKLQMTELSK
jgi:hypothetical protein